MKKKLILVTSPPACGKTYVAMKLAAELNHVVYLDKDALIILSRQIFEVANQPYDRSSEFLRSTSGIMNMRRFWTWQWTRWNTMISP